MSSLRKILLVTLGAIALQGLQACSTETELNPQPLPPQGGEPTRSPSGAGDDEKASDPDNSAGGSSGGTSGTPPSPGAPDAGPEGGDASDGGTE
ncbi:MAG: hypothetical protein JWP87_917 [Labilithrix sp.]|nr:hypothetical protein [Labilithrix sp.]